METTAQGVGREVHTARGRRPSAVCSASRHTPSAITISSVHENASVVALLAKARSGLVLRSIQ